MDGIIVVDKPPDMMSAKLVFLVKNLLKADKVGHAGTLDPFATGVMVCLINRATRLAEFFLHGNKAYSATLCLGIETDTQDFTGTVVHTRDVRPDDFSETDVLSVFRTFEGDSRQTPPCFSALKHRGRPLYEYARKGIRVYKAPRPIRISALTVEAIDWPFIHFNVRCSGGTYIRTLCADIGRALGCGAHLTALRRTETGGFTLAEASALNEFGKQAMAGKAADRMISMNDALRCMPGLVADEELIRHVCHGRPLNGNMFTVDPAVDDRGCFKLVSQTDRLLAVVRKRADAYRYCCVFP